MRHMGTGVLLRTLSIASTALGILGAMENMPMDILATLFGLSLALAWIAKGKAKNTNGARMSLNFPAEELKKGLTIREIQ